MVGPLALNLLGFFALPGVPPGLGKWLALRAEDKTKHHLAELRETFKQKFGNVVRSLCFTDVNKLR